MKAKIIVDSNSIVLFIDGLPHVSMKKSEYVGFNSYIMEEAAHKYQIEYVLKTNKFIVEFTIREQWEQILRELEKLPKLIEKSEYRQKYPLSVAEAFASPVDCVDACHGNSPYLEHCYLKEWVKSKYPPSKKLQDIGDELERTHEELIKFQQEHINKLEKENKELWEGLADASGVEWFTDRERPKTGGKLLVTSEWNNWRHVQEGEYDKKNGVFFFENHQIRNVVAWAYMPKPCKHGKVFEEDKHDNDKFRSEVCIKRREGLLKKEPEPVTSCQKGDYLVFRDSGLIAEATSDSFWGYNGFNKKELYVRLWVDKLYSAHELKNFRLATAYEIKNFLASDKTMD
jgi:hypothetical protein